MKRLTITAVALLLLAPASAEAKSFGMKTTKGNKCRVKTIAQPTTYGIDVDCNANVRRVQGRGYLYVDDFHEVDQQWLGRGPAPFSSTRTSEEPGTRVRLVFTLALKTKKGQRNPELWRDEAGGVNCRKSSLFRVFGDLLRCQVIERTG